MKLYEYLVEFSNTPELFFPLFFVISLGTLFILFKLFNYALFKDSKSDKRVLRYKNISLTAKIRLLHYYDKVLTEDCKYKKELRYIQFAYKEFAKFSAYVFAFKIILIILKPKLNFVIFFLVYFLFPVIIMPIFISFIKRSMKSASENFNLYSSFYGEVRYTELDIIPQSTQNAIARRREKQLRTIEKMNPELWEDK